MKVLIREDQYNRIYSKFKEKLHILFESTQGILFSDEELKELKPKDVIITQDIADFLVRHNKIKPTKKHKSTKPHKQTLPLDVETNYIDFLCEKTKNHTDTPYCELAKLSKKFQPEEVASLNKSINSLFKVFKSKPSGSIPRIIKLALLENTSIVKFLENISEFITNDEYDNEKTKRKLEKLSKKGSTISLTELDEILKSVSNKYEESFVGEGKVFNKKTTSLKLEYNCDKTLKANFFNLVKQIKNDKVGEEQIINNITECIGNTIKTTTPIKADVVTKVSLKLSGGSEIFSAGTYFEVKDFQYYTDSHLSEFFSVFKQTINIKEKPEYIKIYDNLIFGLYKSIKDKQKDFLEDIKKNIGGIILADNLIFKIEDIDLYWSFKGQRKNENRLSIRYQLKPGKEIIAYKCDPYSSILEEVKITPLNINKVGVITED